MHPGILPQGPIVSVIGIKIVQEAMVDGEMITIMRQQLLGRLEDAHPDIRRRFDRNDVAHLTKAGDEILDTARTCQTALHKNILNLPERCPGRPVILVVSDMEADEKRPQHDRAGIDHEPGDEAVVGKQPDQGIDMRAPRLGKTGMSQYLFRRLAHLPRQVRKRRAFSIQSVPILQVDHIEHATTRRCCGE